MVMACLCLWVCVSGSVCVSLSQIEKFGDPNGRVQFTEEDLRERVYSEPTDREGPLNISLLITRREGVMGNITVRPPRYSYSQQ